MKNKIGKLIAFYHIYLLYTLCECMCSLKCVFVSRWVYKDIFMQGSEALFCICHHRRFSFHWVVVMVVMMYIEKCLWREKKIYRYMDIFFIIP